MSNLRVLATGLEFPEGPVAMPDGSVVLVQVGFFFNYRKRHQVGIFAPMAVKTGNESGLLHLLNLLLN